MLHQQETIRDLPTPPPLDARQHALFLDLDGTLVEFAAHPEHVVASDNLRALLRRLSESMNGAVAIITGRTISSADAVLQSALEHVAGVHGAERRVRDATMRAFDDVSLVSAAAAEAQTLVATGALTAEIENKGAALALHYRRKPQFADSVRKTAAQLAHRHGLNILEGKMVVELKLGRRTKADAVTDFMATAPFLGRTPIAIGDDITDEDAFRAAKEHGGEAILVGEQRETAARWRLPNTVAVLAWLQAGLTP